MESFCVGYYDGNVFVVGTSVVGAVLLVTVDCQCTVDVLPMVKFCKYTIRGPIGREIANKAFLMCSFSCCNICCFEQTTLP